MIIVAMIRSSVRMSMIILVFRTMSRMAIQDFFQERMASQLSFQYLIPKHDITLDK